MNTKYTALKIACVTAIATLTTNVHAKEQLPVVATFSILGDMVQRVGGEYVDVTTLVGPNGDTHVYKPTPGAAKAVNRADVLFTNGLEFEGWLDRLAESAEFNGLTVVTTDGIELISMEEHGDEHDDHDDHDKHEDHDDHGDDHHDDDHDEHHDAHEKEGHHDEDKHDDHHEDEKDHHEEKHHEDEHHDDEHGEDKHDEHEGEEHEGDDEHEGHHGHDHGEFDPHAWLSLENAVVYVNNIADGLVKAAPEHAAVFTQNRDEYLAEITDLDAQIKDLISALPESSRTVVTSHDAFQYFARDYELNFIAPQGLSTESEASARDVAMLIKQVRAENISAVFVENVADPRLLRQIARETGSLIGGELYPGALSKKKGPASTYLDLMRHNAVTIAEALIAAKKR